MEKLIINIPKNKSTLVKQMLESLGVIIQTGKKINDAGYKQRLASISIWTEDDLKFSEESKKPLFCSTSMSTS